jgi:ABC-type sugar transport system ATPase subunit
MSVKENLLVSAWCSPAQGSFERSSHWETLASGVLERLDVYPKNSQHFPIQQLSGGNQQKVLLGRVVLSAAPVLLLEEPTGGVDIGSKPELHGLITSIARQGRGVIVASSDPEEILPIADRIIVLFRGRVVGEKLGSETTKAELVQLSLGMTES